MSHKFKRPKPLGKNVKNMKNNAAESPTALPAAQGSAESGISDFLYVDRARISALYAQLYPQGILTGIKTSEQNSSSADDVVGSDVKVFKMEAKNITANVQGIERMFDASWSIPLDVMVGLREKSLIKSKIVGADVAPELGSILLIDAYMRIIDYSTMKDLWEPVLRMLLSGNQEVPEQLRSATSTPEQTQHLIDMLRALPHAMHAHFLSTEGYLWSSIQPSYLTIPVDDVTLKHGGSSTGPWKVLFVLDTYADAGNPPDFKGWSAGETTNGVLTAMHVIRTLIGRPPGWLGITPLMIYRTTPGA